MTVQTIKFGRERFVVLKEKDYHLLQAQAKRAAPQKRGKEDISGTPRCGGYGGG